MSTLRIGTFKDVVLLPDIASSPMATYEALAQPHSFPRYCRHKRQGKFAKRNPKAAALRQDQLNMLELKEGEKLIYGGLVTSHFGHFIAEYVHRLWAFGTPQNRNAIAVFASVKGRATPPVFFESVMKYFGVSRWKILTAPTVISELTIPESGQVFGSTAKPGYVRELTKIYSRHKFQDPASPLKIAIMRGHLQKGRILGEACITTYLSHQGYISYRPENHDFMSQIKAICNAKKIVISEGSACHLFDVLPQIDSEIAFIARRPRSKLHRASLLPKISKLYCYNKAKFLIIPTLKNGKQPLSAALAYVDVSKLIDFLENSGFINTSKAPALKVAFFDDLKSFISTHYFPDQSPSHDQVIKQLITAVYEARFRNIRAIFNQYLRLEHYLRLISRYCKKRAKSFFEGLYFM